VIDAHGLILHVEDMDMLHKVDETVTKKMVYLSHVIHSYANLLKFYRKLLPYFKVWGDFKVHLALIKIAEVTPFAINHDPIFISDLKPVHDKAYIYEGATSYNVLTDEPLLTQELVEFTLDLHWSFGVPIEEKVCREWVSKHIRWN